MGSLAVYGEEEVTLCRGTGTALLEVPHSQVAIVVFDDPLAGDVDLRLCDRPGDARGADTVPVITGLGETEIVRVDIAVAELDGGAVASVAGDVDILQHEVLDARIGEPNGVRAVIIQL